MRVESAQRITFVANELLGFRPAGGLGTATTFLALALARAGHSTQILHYGMHPVASMDPYWTGVYASGGVGIVRVLEAETVEPFHFRRMRSIELALRADPPDVVIAQDLGAPAYSALRLRHLGLAFPDTMFVVFCHGTRRWVTEMSRKLRVTNLHDLLSVSLLEQAAIELADVVVSPSAYLIQWMRAQGWRLPERTLVIPYVTRSGAAGQPPPALRAAAGRAQPVERLAFFGRLEQKKGVEAFAEGLNKLDPELIEGLELEFLGKATPAWPPERVDALLSPTAKRAFRRVSFETALDQPEVIARLGRRGTLAVVPSLGDNSPNTVYECLEHGIPFVASHAGGIGELVAPDDRERVLFEPTPEGIAAALRRALSDRGALRPARASFDDAVSLQRWEEVLAMRPRAFTPSGERPRVDVIVVHRASREALRRCLSALAGQSYQVLRVIVAAADALPDPPGNDLAGEPLVVRSSRSSVEAAREAGLQAAEAPWIVFLDEEDVPEPDLLETLVRAQAASGADAVSCGLYLSGEGSVPSEHFFAGDPGGLGVLANGYGQVALVRRSLLGDVVPRWPVAADPDWPLLARLAARARIVSIPLPLVTRAARPEAIDGQPSDALLVVEQLERGLPDHLRSLARLAAGLAAEMHRPSPAPTVGLARHAVRVLRDEGGLELARRGLRRLSGGAR